MKSSLTFRRILLTSALVALSALAAPKAAAADEEPAAAVPGAPPENLDAKDGDDAPAGQAPAPQAANQPSAQAGRPNEVVASGGGRDQELFDRIKSIVKKMDAQNSKKLEFPSKAIETAMRAEFMRRTEGKNNAWLRGRNIAEGDRSAALDNLELLVTYTERLLSMNKTKKKAKELADLKIMAAKSVIDRFNSARRGERGPASVGLTPREGLGQTGRAEIARRRKLLAEMVAGEDYRPIEVKKIEDFGKRYKLKLQASVAEYEKLAQAMAGHSAGGKKVGKKKKG